MIHLIIFSEISEHCKLCESPGTGKSRECVYLIEIVGALYYSILTLLEVLVYPRHIHRVFQAHSILALLVQQGQSEGCGF